MKNILFISTTSQTGGGPKHLYNLLEHLNREKYKAYVAAPKDGEYFEKFSEFAEVIECDIKHGYLSNLRRLAGFVKEKNIDIVHSHGRAAGVYSRPLKKLCKGIKVVHTFHGIFYENKSKKEQALIKNGEKYLGKYTDMAICVSNKEMEEARKLHFASDENICTIYNGIDICEYSATIDIAEYRKTIGIDKDDFVIGCVARLDVTKGHKELIEAFRKIANQYVNAKLLLVGDGPLRSEISRMLEGNNLTDRCIMLGTRTDVPSLLKCMDVFVLASYKEGLPYTPIEAMAAGIPVVVTDVTGNNEIVRDGHNGLLCKSRDPESLYQAILRIMTDGVDSMAMTDNAKKTVQDEFSVQSMIEQIEKIYDFMK